MPHKLQKKSSLPIISLVLTLLTVFLFLNIYFSQNLPPLYFQLVSEDKKAAVEFLQKIKSFPEFDKQLAEYKNIFGLGFEDEVYAKDRKRRETISYLEELLQKNSQARDVLYALSLLEKEEGNMKLAEDYLKRAKEIDPLLTTH